MAKKPKKPAADPIPAPAPTPPLRLEYRSPAELAENPRNWRTHPQAQVAALTDVLAEVGWAGACLYNERTGRLIDGHARRKVAIEQGAESVPVLIGSWDEATEAKILATLDPLAGMAEANTDALAALLEDVSTNSPAVQSLLDGLTPKAEDNAAADDSAQIQEQYAVYLPCANERDQGAIIAELGRHGLNPKALTIPKLGRHEPMEPTPLPKLPAKARRITRTVSIARTPRVVQVEGIFDLPAAKRSDREWVLDLDLDFPWHIGLIVGPSGSGKSTIAGEVFGPAVIAGWYWPADQALVDGFPAAMSPSEITGLLSSVGLSSPPSWLKPFRVLSTGEQFRATLARTLAEAPALAVVDEFTSVVDRTVAHVGSAALANAVRSSGRRFVAVTCHYDVEEWLQPDWTYDVGSGEFARRALRRRPDIQLRVRRSHTGEWPRFRDHHYLSGDLHRAAGCFVAEVDGQPAAFVGVLHSVGRKSFWREHRCVCLPDFQGVGIGNAVSAFVASLYAAKGKSYRSTTSHPAMVAHRCRSPLWRLRSAPMLHGVDGSTDRQLPQFAQTRAIDRLTASFQYVGPARPDEAKAFGLI
jgi:hypothetical protein